MEQDLYKTRSAAACVRRAYQLYTDNFRKIFRRIWLPALALAVALATAYIPTIRLICPVLSIVAVIWFYMRLFPLFNGQSQRENLTKVLKLWFLGFVISFIAGAIGGAVWGLFVSIPTLTPHLLEAIGILALVAGIVALIFGMPLYYFVMKYVMEDINMRHTLWPSLKTGLRHWGFLFIVMFIAALILGLISIVLFMPMMVLSFAQAQSIAGVVMGDPSGLPSGFIWLLAITAIATFFLLIFMEVWMACVLYYAYGSIEQQERERKAL